MKTVEELGQYLTQKIPKNQSLRFIRNAYHFRFFIDESYLIVFKTNFGIINFMPGIQILDLAKFVGLGRCNITQTFNRDIDLRFKEQIILTEDAYKLEYTMLYFS